MRRALVVSPAIIRRGEGESSCWLPSSAAPGVSLDCWLPPLVRVSRSSMSISMSALPRLLVVVSGGVRWKYALARHAAWTIVMTARKAERMEKTMLIVTSGGRELRERLARFGVMVLCRELKDTNSRARLRNDGVVWLGVDGADRVAVEGGLIISESSNADVEIERYADTNPYGGPQVEEMTRRSRTYCLSVGG